MPEIICEPGRALVAESGSTVVRVNLRKKQKLLLAPKKLLAPKHFLAPTIFLAPKKVLAPKSFVAPMDLTSHKLRFIPIKCCIVNEFHILVHGKKPIILINPPAASTGCFIATNNCPAEFATS